MKRILRVALAGPYTLVGALCIRAAVAFDRRQGRVPPAGLGRRAQRAWCRGMCRLMGVRLQVRGEQPSSGPVLLVANHVSWLDIVCIAALWPVAFLSKSEVRRWPVVGRTASALGTLYIERGRRAAAARAIDVMRERLSAGGRVLFFPEGTTGDGRSVRAFRARLYQAAIDARVPVQAVGLRYVDANGEPVEHLPFTDDQSLITNLWQVAAEPAVDVTLTVGPVRASVQASRSELAAATRHDVAAALQPVETAEEPLAVAG
ncbi:lysophospholipid acyltransferase family protein [Arhodomonas sp. AD133]|uniref:lysophospholipid acyltransferase family protein n=1 Tax=Arhodomonas sp. AD133 TaxID=3415009 RepID=UPI003EB74AD5